MADNHRAGLILGSASPRRADLLHALGVSFAVETVDIDEHALVDDRAGIDASVARIAEAKFAAFGEGGPNADCLLITADTLVACNGQSMGKPDSNAHLREMLAQMSGRTLTIATGLCVAPFGSTPEATIVTTHVQLRRLDVADVDGYVETGVGLDKAGGLALQGEAGDFIATIDGCWSNVLGLPVCAVAAMLDLGSTGQSRDLRCSVDVCGQHGR